MMYIFLLITPLLTITLSVLLLQFYFLESFYVINFSLVPPLLIFVVFSIIVLIRYGRNTLQHNNITNIISGISFKSAITSIFSFLIVFFLFKLEFIWLIKILQVDFLLPIVYGFTAVLIYLLRNNISNNINDQHGYLEGRKLFTIFILSFIFSGICIISLFLYNHYDIDCWVVTIAHSFLDLSLGLHIIGDYNTPVSHDTISHKMDKPVISSESSQSSTPTNSRPGSPTPTNSRSGSPTPTNSKSATPTPTPINSKPSASTTPIDLDDPKIKNSPIITRLLIQMSDLMVDIEKSFSKIDDLTKKLRTIKLENSLKIVDDKYGCLNVEAPKEADDAKLEQIGKKVAVIDGVFHSLNDSTPKDINRLASVYNQLYTIGFHSEERSRLAAKYHDIRINRYKRIIKEYRSLIDKE